MNVKWQNIFLLGFYRRTHCIVEQVIRRTAEMLRWQLSLPSRADRPLIAITRDE